MTDISVVIPTYNRVHLISKTIQCILDQHTRPREVIVIDDNSTDGTVEYLRESFKNDIIVERNRSKGPGAARNFGLEIATGKFIKFFDSDDLMSSNTLQVQCQRLACSSAGFLYSPFLFAKEGDNGAWFATDNAVINYHPFNKSFNLRQWMLRGLFLPIPGMLFRREALREAGPWPEATQAYEDWGYLWKLARVEPYPAHTNECCFLYRQHGAQITSGHSDDVKRDQEAISIFQEIWFDDLNSGSLLDRLYLKNRIYKIIKHNSAAKRSLDQRIQFNVLSQPVFLRFVQLMNKFERMRTGSNWASCYGPETSPGVIKACIDHFNSSV